MKTTSIIFGSILIFIFNLASPVFSQNKPKADSLLEVLASKGKEFDDLTLYKVFIQISIESIDPDKIILYSNKALALAKEMGMTKEVAHSHAMLGEGFLQKGNLVDALNNFFVAKKIYEETGNNIDLASTYNRIAQVYRIENNCSEAIKFYNKALPLIRQEIDSVKLSTILLNVGYAYYKCNIFDSAQNFTNESLIIFTKLNYETGVAYSLGNLGLILAGKGELADAENCMNKAISILEKYNDIMAITEYQIKIADILKEKGKIKEALQYVLTNYKKVKEIGYKEQARDASLKLSELYSLTEDHKKAYKYHTQYVAYRDSINNEEVTRKMADMRTEYEVSQKQAEIDLLTKQRQINRIIGLALVVVTILLAILAFILFRTNRNKQKTNKLLSEQRDELQQQHHKLEALNHTKDRFFSIISHDLRGPVNAFNGISELIRHYIIRNEMGQLQEVSGYIDKSARQLSSLLDNLLDWSVKQQGAFPFFPEKIHLNPLLEEVTQMFLIAAHGKKIILTVNQEETIEVWADRNSLLTVLRNLVNNAIKFTEEHGLVTVSAYQQRGFAMINVIDTGIGIPEDKLENLFKLKEKSIDRGTAGEKGLGIGLSLAFEFAEMNKGSILVTSEENAGTIFTVKIPLYNDHQHREREKTASSNYKLNL